MRGSLDEPDRDALAVIGLALSLAQTSDDLDAWGRDHAATLQSLNPSTLRAARQAFAARRDELRTKT